jgi:hypothetical protein
MSFFTSSFKEFICISSLTVRVTHPANLIFLRVITLIIYGEEHIIKLLIYSGPHLHDTTPSILGPHILLNSLQNVSSAYFLPLQREAKFYTRTKQWVNYVFI